MENKNEQTKKKNREQIRIGTVFAVFFTLLAAANLVLLFVFDYNVPGFRTLITRIEDYRDHVEGVNGAGADASNTVIFSYENEAYTYTGEGDFDPTADVTVTGLDGQELSSDFLTYTVTGEGSKQIVYSYQSDDRQFYGTESRELILENYSAPVIVLSGEAPVLTDGNLAKVADLCRGLCTATDGYGIDISDQVEISAVPSTRFDGTFLVQFAVTNRFGDTAKNELEAATDFKIPHMKLSQKELSLNRGDAFDPRVYILYAVDFDGTNMIDLVEIEGDVNTHMAGTYTVNYDLSNAQGQAVKTKKLTVKVLE